MIALAPTTAERLALPAPAPTDDLVRLFLEGRKATTLAAYRQSLEDLARYVGAPSIDAAARLLIGRGHGGANHLVLSYRADLIGRGLAPATINARLAAIRSLIKLACMLGVVAWAIDVPGVKATAYRDTRGPGRDGVRRLIARAGRRADRKGLRDAAILRLLHDLGLRRGEAAALDVADVDLEGRAVFVTGKGRSERERFTLPDPTAAALAAWLAARGDEPGPLFVNFDRAGKGRRLTGQSIYRIVKDLGQECGIKARPHGLRHSAITAALDATRGDVRAVQRFSRHADLRTLQRYDDNRADLAGEVARLVASDE